MGELLKVTDLSYRHRHSSDFSLHHLDLALGAGEAALILGNSGSGKSTLIEILAGIRKPTSGKITRIQEWVMIPENFNLYPDLTVGENLDCFQRLNGVTIQIDNLLNRLGLFNFKKTPARKLTYGHQKMLQLAVALTYHFSFLLLDDFNRGLDQNQNNIFLALLNELKKSGKGIILATSQAEPIEFFNQGYLLDQGKLISNGSQAHILEHNDEEVSNL